MGAQHTSPVQALLVGESFDGDIYPLEPMARHTTFRIGGPARFFVHVGSIGSLVHLIDACIEEETPWTIVGRGSNLLVADEGFDGVVIVLGRDFRTVRFDEEHMCFVAGAGVVLSAVVQDAFQRSLGGLEFAVGIPGTLGGALRMNAGTRDEWIGSRVLNLTTYTPGKGLARRAACEISWDYRSSSIGANEVVLECEIAVHEADGAYVRGKMEGNLARRKRVQPLDAASCGSVFRNPDDTSAGKLIESVGLKGTSIGDAQISPLHANFIINKGQATARDVCALIDLAKSKVYEAFGIELVPEVRFLGFN